MDRMDILSLISGNDAVRRDVFTVWMCALLVIGACDSGWGQDLEQPIPQSRPAGASDRTPFDLQPLFQRLQTIESRLEEEGEWFQPRFFVDYDRGFVIRPFDKQETPFELKVKTRMQFRYVGFSRDAKTWTDNAGVTRPVEARNDFEIERARLEFLGFFFDPNLQFYISIDADTDDVDDLDRELGALAHGNRGTEAIDDGPEEREQEQERQQGVVVCFHRQPRIVWKLSTEMD